MDLRHLRYFVAVAEELHFGRAAQRLHMAQPPLSRQIRELEGELGVALFRRTTRRVELTDAGTAYLARARDLLLDLDEAGREARLVASGRTGRLTIGCVGSATYSLLPVLAQTLSSELPGLDLAFRGEMLVPDQVQALRRDEIDLALLRPPVPDRSIRLTPLRHERLIVALPTQHPLAHETAIRTEQLRGEDLIVHSGRRHAVMHAAVQQLCRAAGFEPQIRHEVAETSTLVTLVAGGLGIAVVPEPVSALVLAGVTYRPLADTTVGVELAVAHRRDREEPHLRQAVAAVIATVQAATVP